jgi:hypothetical protein
MRASALAPDGNDVPLGAGARRTAAPAAPVAVRTPAGIVALQRRAGNAATIAALRPERPEARREVARTPAGCGGSCACDECRAAGHDEEATEELPVGALLARAVQERRTLQRMAACPSSLRDSDPTPPG